MCNGETATLSATGCAGTVKWSNTSTGTSITVSTSGTYTASCLNSCGESGNSNSVVITTGSSPAAPVISSNKNSLCNGEIATLSATGCAGTVKWSNTSTGTSITVSVAGTYTASCMNNCGESGNSNSVVITTGNSPAAPVISSNKNSLCNGETATLSATGCNGTVKWSNTSTGTSITVSTAGTYTASCMNSCGESGNSNSVVITTGNSPAAPVISSNKNSLCNGETATLSATGCAGTVKWSNTSTGTSITVSVAGTYTASCMNSCGESGNSNSVVITTGSSPAAPVISSNKNSLCNGETATLSATGCAGTVKWSNTSTGTSITVSTSGTYTASCMNSCGESGNSNSVVITTGNSPAAPVISSNKNSLCNGESATLSATGCAGTVKWSNTSTGTSITVSTAGTYTASCLNSCGESGNSNSVVITTGSSPAAPVISSNKNSLCNGESATLSATGCAGTVKWSNTSTGTSITVSTSGTYTASCMNSCGESGNSNSVVITTGSSPAAPVISSNKNSLCNGETATLSATGCAGTVKWSNTSTGTSITVSTAGTYTASCMNSCGESGNSNSVVITTGTSSNPPSISTNKTSLCGTETATLSATGCTGIIVWSNASTGTSITVNSAGTYTAKCTGVGCGESVASNQVIITIGTPPTAPVISTNKVDLCGSEIATLTASGCAGTIKWSNTSTGTSITVSVAGTYTAKCVNSCGESGNSNAVIIKKTELPSVPTVTTNTTSICGTEKATLTASGCLGTVTWSTGSTGTSLLVSTAGTYSVTCKNVCGESNASQGVVIKSGTLPAAPMISSNKIGVCGTEKATLIATECSGTITWSNAATGTSIQVGAGTYTAKCVNSCGTSGNSNALTITTGGNPTAPTVVADKTSLCGTEAAKLTASNCSGTITWSTGATGSTLSVTTAGTYSAICKNDCGTSLSSEKVTITTGGNPSAPTVTSSKTEICTNESAILTAAGCSGIITWSTGATGSTLTVTTVGTYTATCKNDCGTSTTSTPVIIKAKADCGCITPSAPTVVTNKTSLCGTETATLTASNCSATITWSTGATGSTLSVTTAGTYTATCKNDCGTSPASSVITITIGGNPTAPTVVADKTSLCGTETAKLTASNCSGTITWSTGATGSTLSVTTAGTYTAICKNDCGTSGNSNAVIITTGGNPSAPTVTSSKAEICTNESAVLTAAGCSGTITWSTGATGTTLAVTTVGTYTATCKNDCGTSTTSTPVIIKAKANCGDDCNVTAPVITASKAIICKAENVTLTATGCITGTVVWSTGQTGTSVTVKPTATSTYSAVCNVSSTCSSPLSNQVAVKVGSVETPILACSTELVCAGESVTIKASGCEGTIVWSNGSTGSTITVTPDGTSTYTAKCKIGDCESLNAEHIEIAVGTPNKPFISCKNSVICYGGTATLTASGCTGKIVWSNGETTAVINVSPQIEKSTYTAICKSVGGKCESEKSNEIVVTVGKKVDAPKVVAEIKNVCPFNTADLNTAILSEPSTVGGQFEFHTTSSPNSPLVTNPGAVGAGTYYVFERSTVGCYCDGASVKVAITVCEGGVTPSNPEVDIAIKKVASAKIVALNESLDYKVVVKNVGTITASGIEVRDILPSGLTFESVSNNGTFANGIISMKIDSLKKGDSTTFTYKTKVTSVGKIVNKAELFRVKESDTVLSNNSSEAIINDPASGKLIGLSKVSETPVLVSDKIYNVPFVIYVTNLGGEDVSKIQVKDDLNRAFGNGAKILNDTIKVVADAGLVVNPKFTGRGSNTELLVDSLSSIKKGQKLALKFTVKVDLKDATVTNFFNIAQVISNGKTDQSTDGVIADPDGDGDPTNNDQPTPIEFKIDITPNTPAIGIALSVADSAKIDETSYNVTYLALVKNFGNAKLTNVQVSDSLTKTFADSVSYKVVGSTIGSNSTLKLNPNFDGKDDVNLLIADSTSKLEINQLDSLFFTVKVYHNGYKGPYNNNAYAKAIGSGKIVTDISNAGTEIKINESTPTPITLPLTDELIIPEAFSPNGDGKNDNFIIKLPAGAKLITCDIYNRWGHVVFKDKEGILTDKAKGWDGTSNQGIRFGSDGVPDGTYYYALDYELDGKRVHLVNYLTLAR
ncbi:hypothetical protein EMA8858_00001 [Emticicia aquatica]|uniref:DUF11 domain-containing protein n=1 Tax=Emticicia aquatica TaxID=1681835 RepID=A0ABM9AJM3_9BACT|nr:hypothetical protein EMA8858_00001 [Emticicia aquatica]